MREPIFTRFQMYYQIRDLKRFKISQIAHQLGISRKTVYFYLSMDEPSFEAWLERTANGQMHGTTRKVPAEELIIEQAHLRPFMPVNTLKPSCCTHAGQPGASASLRALRTTMAQKLHIYVLPDQRNLLRLGEELLFAPGKFSLSEEGKATVQQLGGTLRRFPNITIEVVGHTDDQPAARSAAIRDNWDLSVLRATSVVRGLVEAGVSPNQISAVGRGPYDPIDRNDREAGRYLNRRTEIVIYRE